MYDTTATISTNYLQLVFTRESPLLLWPKHQMRSSAEPCTNFSRVFDIQSLPQFNHWCKRFWVSSIVVYKCFRWNVLLVLWIPYDCIFSEEWYNTQGCFEEKKKEPKETSFISKWHFMKHACYCRNPDNYRWDLPLSTLRSKHSITDLKLLASWNIWIRSVSVAPTHSLLSLTVLCLLVLTTICPSLSERSICNWNWLMLLKIFAQ